MSGCLVVRQLTTTFLCGRGRATAKASAGACPPAVNSGGAVPGKGAARTRRVDELPSRVVGAAAARELAASPMAAAFRGRMSWGSTCPRSKALVSRVGSRAQQAQSQQVREQVCGNLLRGRSLCGSACLARSGCLT